jgi:hypothetical protein
MIPKWGEYTAKDAGQMPPGALVLYLFDGQFILLL